MVEHKMVGFVRSVTGESDCIHERCTNDVGCSTVGSRSDTSVVRHDSILLALMPALISVRLKDPCDTCIWYARRALMGYREG